MEFVSLVTQGGLLWKAWVACHYERRLKRPDCLNADVKGTCVYIMENMSEIPLRCLGHLMLGILRLLLKQAADLETKAEEVKTALHMSLSTGGLPTVPSVSAASVTLRLGGAVPVLDFGVPGLDMLMEPEIPDLEVEASLEEGRRHVAPMAQITLSSDTPSVAPVVDLDDFGAPSAEDLVSMAAVGKSALDQVAQDAAESIVQRDNEETPDQEMSIVSQELPPMDFLLGASPGRSPPHDHGAAAEAAAREAEAFALSAQRAAAEAAEAAQECEELPPVDFLLRSAPEASSPLEMPSHLKLLLEPEKGVEVPILDCLQDLEVEMPEMPEIGAEDAREDEAPDAPEAPREVPGQLAQQEEMQIVPRKRRRKSIWLDENEKSRVIPERMYRKENTSKITRANPCEYGIFLPHQSYHLGLTTAYSDLCELLSDPLRRAADVGARLRRARVEEPEMPSPPRNAPPIYELPAEAPSQAEEAAPSQDPAAEPAEAAEAAPSQDPAALEGLEGHEEPSRSELLSPEISIVEAVGSMAEEPLSLAEADLVVAPTQSDVETPAQTPEKKAWCSVCQRPEFGNFCPTCGQALQVRPEGLPEETSMVPAQPDAVRAEGLPEETSMVSAQPDAVRAEGLPEETSMVPAQPDAARPEGLPEETSMVPAQPDAARPEGLPDEGFVVPPAKRQAQEGGSMVPVQAAPQVQVKQEHIEVDLNKVSAKQGRELRASLQEDTALSFLELCSSCTAEAAACRFVDLLSLHMSGVVSLQQEKPFGDIAIARGLDWEEWCHDSKRGVKREARATDGPGAAVTA